MAFFASIDDLPAARDSWRTKKRPKEVDPPVPPKPPPPPRKVRDHFCTDGYERVLVYQFGIFMGWTCDRIKNPSVNEREAQTREHITGLKVPLRKPRIVDSDSVHLGPIGAYAEVDLSRYVVVE